MKKLKETKYHWWQSIRFQFLFDIGIMSLATRILTQNREHRYYDVCMLEFRVMKRLVFNVRLYKQPRWY